MTPEYNLFIILAVAVLNAFTAWTTMQSKKVIQELEKNTNSMKDALVAATAKSSLREGLDQGLAQAAATIGTPPNDPIKVEIVKIPKP
jgi:hypothetical protein